MRRGKKKSPDAGQAIFIVAITVFTLFYTSRRRRKYAFFSDGSQELSKNTTHILYYSSSDFQRKNPNRMRGYNTKSNLRLLYT